MNKILCNINKQNYNDLASHYLFKEEMTTARQSHL